MLNTNKGVPSRIAFSPKLKGTKVDKNTYYDTGNEKPFVYGRHEKIQPLREE